MGPFEIMLMACIGAIFGGFIKDIVTDFAKQDKFLKWLDRICEEEDEFDDWIEKPVLSA